jgi:Ser/Thr protein kinase RdoA (MazF antagonist)
MEEVPVQRVTANYTRYQHADGREPAALPCPFAFRDSPQAEHEEGWLQPLHGILKSFGVQLIAPLGGRLNQHWHVHRWGEQLVLRRWSQPGEDMDYELRLLASIAALGWPVAHAIEGPIEWSGHTWSLFLFLPGEPPAIDDRIAEQRARGRLLAEFHQDLARLGEFGQRRGWRRCEQILADPALDRVLAEHERERSEEVRILRWHLDRARARIAALQPHARPGMVIHGDFTPWNLRFQQGRLSGILDFELAHWDHRVGEFALSWRGRHDEVIHAYAEVSPLEPEEWELITPVWWAGLIENACRHLAAGTRDDGWIMKSLLRRSPLMGPDAREFR